MRPRSELCKTPNYADTIIQAIHNFLQQPVLNEVEDCPVEMNVVFKVFGGIAGVKLHLGLSQEPFQLIEH